MAQNLVVIGGLAALKRDLNRLAADESGPLFNAMKRAGYAAVEPVVPATRARLPTGGSGRLAGSLRASAYKSGAAVRMGSKSVPYAGWVEFGGTRRRPHDSNRPYIRSGRYLFPAAADLSPAAAAAYTRALDEMFGSGRVWTNTTSDPAAVHD
jgi:hypothetical protein